jgi:hypothetical protein
MSNYWLDLIEDEEICNLIADQIWKKIAGGIMTVGELLTVIRDTVQKNVKAYPNLTSNLGVNPQFKMVSADPNDQLASTVEINAVTVIHRSHNVRRELP